MVLHDSHRRAHSIFTGLKHLIRVYRPLVHDSGIKVQYFVNALSLPLVLVLELGWFRLFLNIHFLTCKQFRILNVQSFIINLYFFWRVLNRYLSWFEPHWLSILSLDNAPLTRCRLYRRLLLWLFFFFFDLLYLLRDFGRFSLLLLLSLLKYRRLLLLFHNCLWLFRDIVLAWHVLH